MWADTRNWLTNRRCSNVPYCVYCLVEKKEMSFLYGISQPDQQHHEEVGVNPVCQLNNICKFFFFNGYWNGY